MSSRMFFGIAALGAFAFSGANAEIVETSHVEDIASLIDDETWFLVDLDNCLFEGAQAFGHADWFYDQIEQYKQKGLTREQAVQIVHPGWVEAQKICRVKPLEESFVLLLLKLQARGVVVVGLTNRHPSVAEATFRQVASLGVDFSKTAPFSQEPLTFSSELPSLYSKGIIFVGDNKKKKIFNSFLTEINRKPNRVLFIDDKKENVEELEALAGEGIQYHGIYYTAIQHAKPVYIREIANFQDHFESLAKSEKWEEIITQGTAALNHARQQGRVQEEARICAQLTSTAFYQGNYDQALGYVRRCHEISEDFDDPSLFIRALYLESAIYRAHASKSDDQEIYLQAVQTAEEAADIYVNKAVDNLGLEGKVYFNLGAAHADNPIGNLDKAADCYYKALDCFKSVAATDDWIRSNIRLGKVLLLQKKYDASQKIIDEIRPLISNKRNAMHAGYLEAQLKVALNQISAAKHVAKKGLALAETLGAKEDQIRFRRLLKELPFPKQDFSKSPFFLGLCIIDWFVKKIFGEENDL